MLWGVTISALIAALCWVSAISAAVGSGIFKGFTNHISQQISKDKEDFVEAENCTVWFYQQLKKKQQTRPDVEQLSFKYASQDTDQHPCAVLYPKGIDEARSAFAQTQSSLSLSLTFYQFALVGDRDDDGEYDADELKDVFESVGVHYLEGEGAFQHLAKLNGKFDSVRQTVEFSVLTDGMQKLYQKGYRLTRADMVAFNQVTGETQ